MNINVKVAATCFSSSDSILFSGHVNEIDEVIKPNILFRQPVMKGIREFSLVEIKNDFFFENFLGRLRDFNLAMVLDPHPSLILGVLRQIPMDKPLVLIGRTTFFKGEVECHLSVQNGTMTLCPINQIMTGSVIVLEKTR